MFLTEQVQEVERIVLTVVQYCIKLNPYKHGRCYYGEERQEKGPKSFFLHPGEELKDGEVKVQSSHFAETN